MFIKRALQRAAESSPVALRWNPEEGGSRGDGHILLGLLRVWILIWENLKSTIDTI